MEVTIEVHKQGFYVKHPEKFQKELLDRINKSILESGMYLKAELQKNTPVGATGSLRRNWFLEAKYVEAPGSDGGKLIQVNIYNPQIYLEPLDQGRKAAPISKLGMESLALWVQRKLGATLAESKPIAFAIARKKALFPTPGQKFVEKTLEETFPKILQRLDEEFGANVKETNSMPSDGSSEKQV